MATVLSAATAQAQFYLGGEGGWTGLEGTRSSINGINPITKAPVSVPINQSFNDGFNAGARLGYQMGRGGLKASTAIGKTGAMRRHWAVVCMEISTQTLSWPMPSMTSASAGR